MPSEGREKGWLSEPVVRKPNPRGVWGGTEAPQTIPLGTPRLSAGARVFGPGSRSTTAIDTRFLVSGHRAFIAWFQAYGPGHMAAHFVDLALDPHQLVALLQSLDELSPALEQSIRAFTFTRDSDTTSFTVRGPDATGSSPSDASEPYHWRPPAAEDGLVLYAWIGEAPNADYAVTLEAPISYAQLDGVDHDDRSWICKVPHTASSANEPTNANRVEANDFPWDLLVDASGREIPTFTDHPVWVRRVDRVGADEGFVVPEVLQSDTIQFTVPRQRSIAKVDATWRYRDDAGKVYSVVAATPSTGRRKTWRIAAERAEGSQ